MWKLMICLRVIYKVLPLQKKCYFMAVTLTLHTLHLARLERFFFLQSASTVAGFE